METATTKGGTMSDRITAATLDARCNNVNRRLGEERVAWQARNGYIGLDEYNAGGAMVRTLTIGTKREVGEFLHAMMVGIDLSRTPSTGGDDDDDAPNDDVPTDDDTPERARLEELRTALRAEHMSWGELAELQSLAEHIDPSDVELLEAAGVPEHDDDDDDTPRATIDAVRMEVIPDNDHDASYLEQEGWEERRAAYERGEFGFVGVRAAADIRIRSGAGWICQTITSPGLWSIEDDSRDDYLAEVFEEEKGELATMLTALGIDATELTGSAPADPAAQGFGLEQARTLLEGTTGYETRQESR